MVLFGRALAVLGVVGFVLGLSLGNRDFVAYVEGRAGLEATLGIIAALAALAWFVSWFLAIYHWGMRGPARAKRAWGVVVIVVMVFGSWAYWWLAGEQPRDPERLP